jgi:hypothetical protein
MEHEQQLQAGRQALQDPVLSEHLRRTRPRIERLLGLLAHRYGARKCRYIGSAKARCRARGQQRWSTSTRSVTDWRFTTHENSQPETSRITSHRDPAREGHLPAVNARHH